MRLANKLARAYYKLTPHYNLSFSPNLDIITGIKETLYIWTASFAVYKLYSYFRRKLKLSE